MAKQATIKANNVLPVFFLASLSLFFLQSVFYEHVCRIRRSEPPNKTIKELTRGEPTQFVAL